MSESIGSNKRILKNTLFLYFRMGISLVVSLFTARVVISTLGDVDYGILNVVGGCVAIFTFLNAALSGSASRFITFELGKSNNKELLIKTFSASLTVHILLAIIIVFLSETIGLWLLENKLVIPADRMFAARWAFQLSILMCVVGIIQVPFGAVVIAHEKMNVYALLSVVDVIIRLLLIYLIQTISGDKLILWSIMTLIVSSGYFTAYVIYCRKSFEEVVYRFHKDIQLYKNIFLYAWWDLIGNASVMLQGEGINILLNTFFGPIINAARAISFQIQGALSQFSGGFMTASRPQIVKLYAAEEYEKMVRLIFLSSTVAFYLSFILMLPVGIEIKYILKLWLKNYPEYTPIFAILIMVNGLIISIKTPRIAAIHATGHIKATNLSVGIILCLIFPVGYILLKCGLSVVSVFIAIPVITLISEIVAINLLRKYIDFSVRKYWVNIYLRPFVVGIISLLLPLYLHYLLPESFFRLMVVIITSFVCVALFGLYLGMSKAQRYIVIEKTKEIFQTRMLNKVKLRNER